MDIERVIVYIDENTDDGMMWEELNQKGQMQVSVYDEEFEYDVEYHHSIKVKSLQEYLAEHDKQVRKEVCKGIKKQIKNQYVCFDSEDDRKAFNKILKQIQGVEDGKINN